MMSSLWHARSVPSVVIALLPFFGSRNFSETVVLFPLGPACGRRLALGEPGGAAARRAPPRHPEPETARQLPQPRRRRRTWRGRIPVPYWKSASIVSNSRHCIILNIYDMKNMHRVARLKLSCHEYDQEI